MLIIFPGFAWEEIFWKVELSARLDDCEAVGRAEDLEVGTTNSDFVVSFNKVVVDFLVVFTVFGSDF